MNNTEIFKYLPNYHDPVVDIEKALRNNSWLGDAAATIAMMDNDTIPVTKEFCTATSTLTAYFMKWRVFTHTVRILNILLSFRS